MIIQCENCRAKFRLDDSKIPQKGRKVRCSKCQQVFFVCREPSPELVPQAVPEADSKRQDSWEVPTPLAQEPPIPPEPEPAFEPTVRIDLAAQEEPSFRDEEEPLRRSSPAPVAPRRSLMRPLLAASGIVASLAVVILVLARLGFLPFLFPQPEEPPTARLIIDQAQLQGKWEKNAQVPRIFVITGTVQNKGEKTKAFIKVRGLLLDKAGRTVKEVWAYCGNSIPLEDLRIKAPSEIQNTMRNREGQHGANKQVPAGARIPFTLVFFEVPEGVETFGAEVVEAQVLGT